MSWDEPNEEDISKDQISGYTVQYQSEGSARWAEAETKKSPAQITGLKEGTNVKLLPMNSSFP